PIDEIVHLAKRLSLEDGLRRFRNGRAPHGKDVVPLSAARRDTYQGLGAFCSFDQTRDQVGWKKWCVTGKRREPFGARSVLLQPFQSCENARKRSQKSGHAIGNHWNTKSFEAA